MILNSAIVQKKERNCRSCLKQRGGGSKKFLMLIFGTCGKGDHLRNLGVTF